MSDAASVPSASYFVSIVVPLWNDADVLETFVDGLLAVVRSRWRNFEVVLVDDGSRDATLAVVASLLERHESVRYMRLARAFGVEIAISAGLDSVIGDVIVVLQPAEDPPALIPRFVDAARAGNGIVFGVRTNKDRREGVLYGLGRSLFTRLVRRILDIELPRNTTLFLAMTRQTMNAVGQIKDKSRALRIFGSYVGYENRFLAYETIPQRVTPRAKGLREAVERGLSLLVTNSMKPLRIVSLLGLALSILNALYLLYVVAIALFKPHPAEGWISANFTSGLMFMFLFLILSVLCEYIGRLLIETRDRPLYFVAEERYSSVLVRDEDRRNVVRGSA